jgi:hypothetical protein
MQNWKRVGGQDRDPVEVIYLRQLGLGHGLT